MLAELEQPLLRPFFLVDIPVLDTLLGELFAGWSAEYNALRDQFQLHSEPWLRVVDIFRRMVVLAAEILRGLNKHVMCGNGTIRGGQGSVLSGRWG